MNIRSASKVSMLKHRFLWVFIYRNIVIIFLLSQFLTACSSNADNSNAGDKAKLKKDTRTIVDEVLHNRMGRLEKACEYVSSNSQSGAGIKMLQQEEGYFLSVVDSLMRVVDGVTDEAKKKEVQSLMNIFSYEAQNRVKYVKNFISSGRDTAQVSEGGMGVQLQELKNLLAQKEARISALEKETERANKETEKAIAMNQNKPVVQRMVSVQNSNAYSSEWKEKYNNLKAANEKANSQLNSLRESYKEIVNDNRRLISQLQALRAGKS